MQCNCSRRGHWEIRTRMPYGVQINTPLSVNAIFFWINIRVYSVRNIYRVRSMRPENKQAKYVTSFSKSVQYNRQKGDD